jgi:glutaredoxin
MKQQCNIWSIWLTWLALPALAGAAFYFFGWPAAVAVAAAAVAWQLFYLRAFPRLSASMGYGSVADVPASTGAVQPLTALGVTFYTASACPFCPLVRTRLLALQQRLGFELTELDVTLRPAIISAKGIRAVPAVEVKGRLHTGNATSAELLALISQAGAPAA